MIARLRPRAPAALTLSALLLVTAPGAAQEPPPAQPDTAQVNQHYERGLKAARNKDWPQARDAFLQAFRLRDHYQIAANLGRAELMVGAYRDAAEHLAYFLRGAPSDLSAEDRAQTQQWLDEARAKIGVLTVKLDPPAAELLLDGVPVPAPRPPELYVDPGRHRLEARLAGHRPVTRDLELAPGQGATADLRLTLDDSAAPPRSPPQPSPPPAPPRPSAVLIGVGIGAAVASAAAGAALMAMATGRQRDAEGAPDRADLLRTGGDLESGGIAAFIGAGMIGVATAAYALSGQPSARPASSAGLRLQVAPARITLQGVW